MSGESLPVLAGLLLVGGVVTTTFSWLLLSVRSGGVGLCDVGGGGGGGWEASLL